MKKKYLALLIMAALVMAFCLCGCGQSEEPAASESAAQPAETSEAAAPEVDASMYGYDGSDPVEVAVYKYMAEEVSKDYDPADASIPTVSIVKVDAAGDETLVYGDFWVENYKIEGDTLRCVSGGNYPGVMHLDKDNVVTKFDQVADGSEFDASAKELFGGNYDAFMKVFGDSDARAKLRTATVTNYVRANDLKVTKYQDEGWDPVEIGE